MGVVAAFDAVCLVFFIFHLPTSLLIDAQIVLNEGWFPGWARKVLDDYITESHDPIMTDPALWFRAMVVMEMVVQVPFFVLAIFCYIKRSARIRIPAILYSAHTCTTLIPILAQLIIPYLHGDVEYSLTRLLVTYGPFFIIPFLIGVRWVTHMHEPFAKPTKSKDA